MIDAADRTLKSEHPDSLVTAFVGIALALQQRDLLCGKRSYLLSGRGDMPEISLVPPQRHEKHGAHPG